MFRKPYALKQQFVVATALALGASGIALADDSSMRRFGGDSYAYFNQPMVRNAAADPTWRQSHPNGLTERELQALSSSDLSASAQQLNPQVLASAAADPAWRQSHPNGFTERELEALSSSPLAAWQLPTRSRSTASASIDEASAAQASSKETLSARLARIFRSESGDQAGSN
jgi:hypothetical protein